MPGGENGSLGGKLGNFVIRNGMSRDGYFRVDFLTNIGTANQTKVNSVSVKEPRIADQMVSNSG